jgi:hypothetical protein
MRMRVRADYGFMALCLTWPIWTCLDVRMPDHITIPAQYMGAVDATLTVESDSYGDRYSMTLAVLDRVIARGEGFGPGAACDFATSDEDDARHLAHTVDTFGAFLAHALESSEDDAREGWSVLTDDASDWVDALTIYAMDLEGQLS